MKHNVLFIGLLLSLLSNVFGQLPEVTLNDKRVEGKMNSKIVFTGECDNGYFTVRYLAPILRKPKILIQKFDKNMNPTKQEIEVETDVDTKGSIPVYQDVLWLGDKLYLFTVQYGNKVQIFYRQEINPNTLTVSAPMEVAQVRSTLVTFVKASDMSSERMFMRTSPDSSKVLLGFLPKVSKDENVITQIQVWDNTFETKLWDKEIKMKYSLKLGDIESIKVDNNGSAYVLSTQYRDVPREKVRQLPNYDFVLTACTNLGEEVVHQKIQIKDKFVNDIGFAVQENGDVLCIGFFSPNNTYNLKGTCMFRFNPQTGESVEAGYEDFPANFLAQYQDGKEVNRKDELSGHNIDYVIPESNGDVSVIAEQAYTYLTTEYVSSGKGGYTRTVKHYVNNDIIVFRYDGTGKLKWIKKIPKRQHTTDDGGIYTGYKFIRRGENLVLIYGDNDQNSLDDPKKVKRYPPGLFGASHSVLAMVTIQPDGKMNRDELINLKEEGYYPAVQLSHNDGNKQLIFLAVKGFTVRLGKVKW